MRWILALPLVALTACSDKGADAEARYKLVERNGTKGDLCKAAGEVADEYLRAGNEAKYKNWLAIAGMRCQLAEYTGSELPASESETTRNAAADAESAMDAAENAAFEAAADAAAEQ